ncbi:MAG: hypothetical protein JXK05_02795 [Campylobacterales bacterium]|nr:hypothetical protein [Campylobacterales bacterium]
MMLLQNVERLLEHIRSVEADVIALSKESMLKLAALLERQGVGIDDDAAEALQYQDIIAQQLSATIEAIESVRQLHLSAAEPADATRLNQELEDVLERAKERRQAFTGNVHHVNDDESIEFF